MDPTLRMYAVIRKDLDMTPGKLASQSGHAFVNAFDTCCSLDLERANEYHKDGIGTKVVLDGDSEDQLRYLYGLAKAVGLPCALIIDSGHVMPPYFDGTPIVTALGIGPARREEVTGITSHLSLTK